MKRYVKEFANDIINGAKGNELMQDKYKKEIITKATKLVKLCERGLITNKEAVVQLAKL